MIQTLARKRTQLGALAALAGLVVALFAVLQPAQAANAVVISLNDSDNVVKAGAGYEVHVRVLDGATNNSGNFTLEYLIADAGVALSGTTLTDALEATVNTADAEATLVVPAAAAGVYTITAGVLDVDGGPGLTELRLVGSLEVTVGEIGEGVGAAELSLGFVDTPTGGLYQTGLEPTGITQDTDTAVFSASAAAGNTNIVMVLSVKNSLGNKTNNRDVSNITLIAQGGRLSATTATFTAGSDIPSAGTPGSVTYATNATANQSTTFSVSAGAPGVVNVWAIVVGADGSQATSERFTLNFSGGPFTISSGPAKSALNVAAPGSTVNSGHAIVEATTVDAGGRSVAVATDITSAAALQFDQADIINVRVTDADDKIVTGRVDIGYARMGATDTGNPEAASPTVLDTINETLISRNAIGIVIRPGTGGATAPALPAGTYTVSMGLLDSASTATGTFNVVGPLANIEVSADKEVVAVGEVVVVTAVLTDAVGLPRPNGVRGDVGTGDDVLFTSAGSLNLVGFGANAVTGVVTKEVANGMATATFVATQGSGSATILVNSAGKTGAVTITAEAVEAAEEEPEVVSLDCLSSNQGFSTYTCGVDSSASELFALVSGRGATAIQLWNGSMWVRYSVVDGAEIPGSSDFIVTEDDILYISN